MDDIVPVNCPATKHTPTANAEIEVPCVKAADHVELGDQQHEGRLGVFPVRWRDSPQS